jgi:hypothetical protein
LYCYLQFFSVLGNASAGDSEFGDSEKRGGGEEAKFSHFFQ